MAVDIIHDVICDVICDVIHHVICDVIFDIICESRSCPAVVIGLSACWFLKAVLFFPRSRQFYKKFADYCPAAIGFRLQLWCSSGVMTVVVQMVLTVMTNGLSYVMVLLLILYICCCCCCCQVTRVIDKVEIQVAGNIAVYNPSLDPFVVKDVKVTATVIPAKTGSSSSSSSRGLRQNYADWPVSYLLDVMGVTGAAGDEELMATPAKNSNSKKKSSSSSSSLPAAIEQAAPVEATTATVFTAQSVTCPRNNRGISVLASANPNDKKFSKTGISCQFVLVLPQNISPDARLSLTAEVVAKPGSLEGRDRDGWLQQQQEVDLKSRWECYNKSLYAPAQQQQHQWQCKALLDNVCNRLGPAAGLACYDCHSV
jgi:hypothetical protein